MIDLKQQSLAEYLTALASAAPVPGGGAAACVMGAQAAALLAMAAGVSATALGDAAPPMLARLEQARTQLLNAADEDARVFMAVMAAFRIPKEDAQRPAALDVALKEATLVPLAVMRAVASLYAIAQAALPAIKRHVISDVGVAIRCADAALASCAYTARINLASVKDAAFVDATRAELDEILRASAAAGGQLLRAVDVALAPGGG